MGWGILSKNYLLSIYFMIAYIITVIGFNKIINFMDFKLKNVSNYNLYKIEIRVFELIWIE